MPHPVVLTYLAEARIEQAMREARYPRPMRGWKLFRRSTRPAAPRRSEVIESGRPEKSEDRIPTLV